MNWNYSTHFVMSTCLSFAIRFLFFSGLPVAARVTDKDENALQGFDLKNIKCSFKRTKTCGCKDGRIHYDSWTGLRADGDGDFKKINGSSKDQLSSPDFLNSLFSFVVRPVVSLFPWSPSVEEKKNLDIDVFVSLFFCSCKNRFHIIYLCVIYLLVKKKEEKILNMVIGKQGNRSHQRTSSFTNVRLPNCDFHTWEVSHPGSHVDDVYVQSRQIK